MVVSGILGRGNLAGLAATLVLPEEIYAGLPTLVTVRLENRKRWFPAFLIRIDCSGSGTLVTAIGARQTVETSFPLTLPVRGRHTLAGPRVTSAFPVNFFIRHFNLPGTRTVIVFPAPRQCPAVAARAPGPERGAMRAESRGYEGDVTRISDYRGEPLKLIHWKLSARQDELKVRELSAEVEQPFIIDPDDLPGSRLEERLGCACFLVSRLHRQGRPVGLRLGGRLIAPALSRSHRLRLLSELACHDKN